MNSKQIAEAFSGHRFPETFHHLAANVRWVLPGQETIEGRSAVIDACNSSAAQMANLEAVEFTRFVSVSDDRVAAIDAVARYVSADGTVSIVSSADIYEFDDNGRVAVVTSYAVELDE